MQEVQIYIEGQKIDLFDDENINIKSSVQDIRDISKVFADFSQSFTIPASDNNNKIFKHYYNADIINGFDARTKKNALIEINHITFRKGKIRLIDCQRENNLITHYKLNFEGDVVKVKDLMGDDKLNTLDLSAFNHDYTDVNVYSGLTSNFLSSGSIIYPLISPIRRFLYDITDTISSDATQTNLHYNAAIDSNSVEFTEIKPAIKVSDIIDAIQVKYDLTFTGDFFNRDYYTGLYLWLNKDEGKLKSVVTDGSNQVNFDGGSTQFVDLGTDIYTPIIPSIGSNVLDTISSQFIVTVPIAFDDVEYSIVVLRDDVEYVRIDNITGDYNYTSIQNFNDSGKEYKYFIETNTGFQYSIEFVQTYIEFLGSVSNFTTTASLTVLVGTVDIAYQTPDIKSYDFLFGIVKMFNLTLVGNNDGSISFQTLNDWYKDGNVYDITKYVDIKKHTVSRGKLNSEFTFNYEEPSTILAKEFKSNNGVAYGDLEAKILDENDQLLDGGKLEIKVPFENLIYEKILDVSDNSETNIQYGSAVDKEQNPTVTKPILFYNTNVNVAASLNPIGFLDSGGASQLVSNVNTPNNNLSLTNNDNQSLNFGAEFSTYNYGLMETSLYNSFYEDYVTDMFSNQRRVFSFDSVLPNEIVTKLKLNDRLIIGNTRYIINDNNYSLTQGTQKLNLLNDIYEQGDLVGDTLSLSRNFIITDKTQKDISVTAYASGETIVTVIDEGFGIFVTVTGSPITGIGSVNLDIEENLTGLQRIQTIRFTNGSNIVDLTIQQLAEVVKFDNDILKFDSTLITFDNG